MGGDHHYTPPKTDGTFGLKTNWQRLSSQKIQPTASQTITIQPISPQEWETKTLKEWFYWREWRKESPLARFSPSFWWKNYQAKNFTKVPSGRIIAHWMIAVGTASFLIHYGKNSTHLFAKNH